jgi:hypothetical protein
VGWIVIVAIKNQKAALEGKARAARGVRRLGSKPKPLAVGSTRLRWTFGLGRKQGLADFVADLRTCRLAFACDYGIDDVL